MGAGTVSCSLEGETFVVTSGSRRSVFQTMNVSEYPVLADHGAEIVTFSAEEANDFISFGGLAAGSDETRPAYCSILFEANGKKGKDPLHAVSTDGYRLSLYTSTKQVESEDDIAMLLSAKVVKDIYRSVSKKITEVTLGFSKETSMAYLSFGETEVRMRVFEAAFPPYKTIIPEKFAFQYYLPREELQQTLRSALIFARDASDIVHVSLPRVKGDGTVKPMLSVRASSGSIGEFTADIECEVLEIGEAIKSENTSGDTGGEIEKSGKLPISLNARYVLDALAVLPGDRVWFGMNDPLKPAMFRAEADSKNDLFSRFFYLIMPFKAQKA